MNVHKHISLKSLTLTKTFHMSFWAGMPFLFTLAHFLAILQVSAYTLQALQRSVRSLQLGYWGYWLLLLWSPTAVSPHLIHCPLMPYVNYMLTFLFISLDITFFEADVCPSMLKKNLWHE